MQLTRPLHEDSPQWEWFKRAVVTTIKKNGKVDYDTKIRLTSTIIWCLGAFDVVRKTINLTYQGKVAPWNAKYNIVEKKTREKYPNTLKGRIALNKVLFAFFRASQVEKNTDTGTEAISMFGMERLNRKGKLIRTGLITLALGSGLFLTLGNRHSTDVEGMIGGYKVSGPANQVLSQSQLQHAIKHAKIPSAKLQRTSIDEKLKEHYGVNDNQPRGRVRTAHNLKLDEIEQRDEPKNKAAEKAELDEHKNFLKSVRDMKNNNKKEGSAASNMKEAMSDIKSAQARVFEHEFYGRDGYKQEVEKTGKHLQDANMRAIEKGDPHAEKLYERLAKSVEGMKRSKDNYHRPIAELYKQEGYRDTKHMVFSNKGYDMLKLFEGYSATAYKDVGGVWTVGTGHTGSLSAIGKDRDVQQGDTITDAEGHILAYRGPGGIKKATKAVRDLVKVRLTQAQFDAAVSFVYNNGRSRFANSTLLSLINQMTPDILKDSEKKSEHMDKIEEAFKKYSYVKNKFYRGLQKRRIKEAALFRDGTYPTSLD